MASADVDVTVEALLVALGIHSDNASTLKRVIRIAITDQSGVDPVEIPDDAVEEMEEVDDAVGMADALGHLATALININDALV